VNDVAAKKALCGQYAFADAVVIQMHLASLHLWLCNKAATKQCRLLASLLVIIQWLQPDVQDAMKTKASHTSLLSCVV
jgi:hypothetical protein